MKYVLSLTLCLLPFCTAFAQGSPGVVDAKELAKIRAQESVVTEKQKGLLEANRKLQDEYVRFQTMFQDTQSGASTDVVKDLARVLSDSISAVNKDLMGGRKGPRVKRGFAKTAGKALSKVEHELLVALKPRLKNAAIAALDVKLKDGAEALDDEDFARTVVRTLLPKDTPFWKHWNETILDSCQNREPYIAAFNDLQKSQQNLLVLKDAKMRFTLGAPPGMARISSGKITIESTYGFSVKKRAAKHKEFFIDLHEVTHADYWSKFWVNLKEKDKKAAYLPKYKDQRGREIPQWIQDPETGEYMPIQERMNWPVTGIDIIAARAFAESQGKRLPTEAEWMAAATAAPGKTTEYPWGEAWAPELANDGKAKNKAPIAVGSFPSGRSFHGVHDMAGNVKEWTNTLVSGKDAKGNVKSDDAFVIRGGSFESTASGISLKWRWQLPGLNTKEKDVGFRCVMDVK